MKEMLRELWRGNIAPMEEKKRCSENTKLFAKKMAKCHDAVVSTLADEQLDLFESYVDCIHEYADRAAEDAFCEGFRLASRLTAEAFCEK